MAEPVQGHALLGAGAAYAHVPCLVGDCACFTGRIHPNRTGFEGHARCECGAHGPHVRTALERKAWHVKHRQSVAPLVVQTDLL